MLIINSVQYPFLREFIKSKSCSIGNNIQLPTKPDYPPIITPNFCTAHISLAILYGDWMTKLTYKTAKEVIP